MKTKTLYTLLASLMATFYIGNFSACQLPGISETSSESTFSESTTDSSSQESDYTSADSGKSDNDSGNDSSSSTTPVNPKPVNPDKGDLAVPNNVRSVAPVNYGTTAQISLQNEQVSPKENSTSALSVVFNTKNAPVYTDTNGNKRIWTFLSFDFQKMYGANATLNNTSFVFDLYTQNCHSTSSIILVDNNGNLSKEISFNTEYAKSDDILFQKECLSSRWLRITINLPLVFQGENLQNLSELRLTFSNPSGNSSENSTFILDNAHFEKAADYTVEVPNVYNPNQYYDKRKELDILLTGYDSSHVNVQIWLQKLFTQNQVNAYVRDVFHYSKTMQSAYELAFGAGGYMQSLNRPDVLLATGFFSAVDYYDFGTFLNSCYEYAPTMEVIAYADEFCLDIGQTAAHDYGVDYCDWQQATAILRAEHGFTDAHLVKYSYHSKMSALVGALCIYAQLYGELPDKDAVMETILESVYSYDDLTILLPGITEQKKRDALTAIFDTVEEIVLDNNSALPPDNPNNPVTPPDDTGETDKDIFATSDIDDYANLDVASTTILGNWNVHASLAMQSDVICPLTSTTSALRATFNNKNADTYTGYGGNSVWSVIAFDVKKMTGGNDLTNQGLDINIKAVNCNAIASIALVDVNGNKIAEPSFDIATNNQNSPFGIYKMVENDGWLRFRFFFSDLFQNYDVSNIQQICLVFSNVNSDESKDSIVYFDNAIVY